MEWDIQRGDSQRLDTKTKSSGMGTVEERKLNLADTEGMFLLMAIGYVVAGSVLFSEIVGGCAKSCRAFIRRSSVADGGDSRRGSQALDDDKVHLQKPRTFTDKLKHNIRRRLRSQPEHQEADVSLPNEAGPSNEPVETEVNNVPKPLDEPVVNGPTSFCTLKRILLMRKQRKAAQPKTSDEPPDGANEEKEQKLENKSEHHIEIGDGAVGGGVSNVTIENEKNGDSYDDGSSIQSDSQTIREETEAEINQLTVDSDRVNNPSKEFGELV